MSASPVAATQSTKSKAAPAKKELTMRILSLLLPASLLLAPAVGQAGDFDGKKPFVCTLVEIASCVPGHDCARENADAIGVPHFYAIDVAKNEVGETRPDGSAGRTSKIDRVEH